MQSSVELDETFDPDIPYMGLHLYVNLGLYTHHGIGDTQGGVIHYSGLVDTSQEGRVCRISFAEFAQGEPIYIKSHTRRKYNLREAVMRAESRLDETDYSLWRNNCEHFVEWCIEGVPSSTQVEVVKQVGVALALRAFPAATPFVIAGTLLWKMIENINQSE